MDQAEKRSGKLKIKEIIDEIDAEDLRAFIRNYARHDKMLEWTLKSHFLSRINVGEGGEKYKKVLDELVPPRTNRNSKISAPHNKTLGIIFRDFAEQMFDRLSNQDFIEAWYLSYFSLNKIVYLQQKYRIRNKSIEASRLEFLKGLDLILQMDLAPAFRQNVEEKLKALILTSYYFPANINLIQILDENHSLTASDKQEVITSLINKFKEAENQAFLLKTILHLAYPIPEIASGIVRNFDHKAIYEGFKMMIKEGSGYKVVFYLDTPAINFEHHNETLRTLLAAEAKDHADTARHLLSVPLDRITILELKSLIEELPDSFFEKSFGDIKEWLDSLQFDIRSMVYARAGQFEGLLNLLHEKGEYEWLTVYDELLIEEGYQKEIGQLYQFIAGNYLETHLGRKAFQFLEKMNARLIHLHQRPMLDRIHRSLQKDFGHRKTIKNLIS